MSRQKQLEQILNNNKNVRFGEFVSLVEAFGFRRLRGEGSHNIYARSGVREMVNIQNDNGKAKPYQIRQFLGLVEKYNLTLEDEQ